MVNVESVTPTIDPSLMGPAPQSLMDREFFGMVEQLDAPLAPVGSSLAAEVAEFNARFHRTEPAQNLGGTAVDSALLGPDALDLTFDNLSYDHLKRKDKDLLAALSTHDAALYYEAAVTAQIAEAQYRQMQSLLEDSLEADDDTDDEAEEHDEDAGAPAAQTRRPKAPTKSQFTKAA
jgi:hypothetical protein